MDNQSNVTENAVRAAGGGANIARGAAYGGLYGAAAEAVKSFFPEIVKGGVILLFVIILGPLLIFTALPNILFGFDSATPRYHRLHGVSSRVGDHLPGHRREKSAHHRQAGGQHPPGLLHRRCAGL